MDFESFLLIIGAGALIVGAIFLFAILGSLIGLFVGWIISITPLGPFVTDGFNAFGFQTTGLLPQIGAAIGFVAGLFGGSHYSSKKEDS